jgi:Neuraminidase (sialidase)
MKNYQARIVDNTINEYLETFGAVIIEGARATGKTTTAKNASKSNISLDKSPQIAALAQTDPQMVFFGDTPSLGDAYPFKNQAARQPKMAFCRSVDRSRLS